MVTRCHQETVVRLRAMRAEDPRKPGRTAEDWSHPTRQAIPAVSLQPVEGTEDMDGRDQRTDRLVMRALGWPPLTDLDRVEARGHQWAVDGPVQRFRGGRPHTVVQLRRVTG